MLLSLGLAARLARRMAARMSRPFRELIVAARALASGDLDHRVPAAKTAELQALGGAFNRMAAALREQHDRLERQAFTDSLTGIANRALFERRASRALEHGARC